MSFLTKLEIKAQGKLLQFPEKEKKSLLFEKITKGLEKEKLKGVTHNEKMKEAAKQLKINYPHGSVFMLLDAMDGYIAKHASGNHELSKIVFQIKGLKADQRRDLSNELASKKIQELREHAVKILLNNK